MARQPRRIRQLVFVAFGVLAVEVEQASATEFSVGGAVFLGVPNEATSR